MLTSMRGLNNTEKKCKSVSRRIFFHIIGSCLRSVSNENRIWTLSRAHGSRLIHLGLVSVRAHDTNMNLENTSWPIGWSIHTMSLYKATTLRFFFTIWKATSCISVHNYTLFGLRTFRKGCNTSSFFGRNLISIATCICVLCLANIIVNTCRIKYFNWICR